MHYYLIDAPVITFNCLPKVHILAECCHLSVLPPSLPLFSLPPPSLPHQHLGESVFTAPALGGGFALLPHYSL